MPLDISTIEALMNRDYKNADKRFYVTQWGSGSISSKEMYNMKKFCEFTDNFYTMEMQLHHHGSENDIYNKNFVKFLIKRTDSFVVDNAINIEGSPIKAHKFLEENFKVNDYNQNIIDFINCYIQELKNIGIDYDFYKNEIDYKAVDRKVNNQSLKFSIQKRYLIKNSEELQTKYTVNLELSKASGHYIHSENITFKIIDEQFLRGKSKNRTIYDLSSKSWMKKDVYRLFFKIHKDLEFVNKEEFKKSNPTLEDFQNLAKIVEMYSL